MKELDFRPAKSKEEFRSNYKLHDLSEQVGKNLLVQWGFDFKTLGEDKRYQKLWEKGEDKPDIILTSKGKSALLDWLMNVQLNLMSAGNITYICR